MPNEGNRPAPPGDYVLDSYALLAFFEDETGSKRVSDLLEAATNGNCRLYLCIINLGEILYIIERERGLSKAQETLARIDEFPIEIVDADRNLTLAAAHLKSDCPVAYADCFAAALTMLKEAALVTGDIEFKKIQQSHHIQIEWLPPIIAKS